VESDMPDNESLDDITQKAQRNWQLFIALAPLVLGTVAVLLPMSVFGLFIGIGLFGILGIMGLLWCWINLLLQPSTTSASISDGGLALMGLGCFASIGGVFIFFLRPPLINAPLDFFLALWSVIFAGLTAFFGFGYPAFHSRQDKFPKTRFGIFVFVLLSWAITAIMVIAPYKIYAAR
jgi:hypothetical protein